MNIKATIYSNIMDKLRARNFVKIDMSTTLSGDYQRLKLNLFYCDSAEPTVYLAILFTCLTVNLD